MKNFKICQKLNYDKESVETKTKVDKVISRIRQEMNSLGYVEVNDEKKDINYVFSVGGDGTMLNSMHHHIANNAVVIGINAGNVGFLTPFDISDVETDALFELIKNPSLQRVEGRTVLEHYFAASEQSKGIAVNEYAITAEAPNDMLDFELEVEYRGYRRKAGIYRANAIVVSGPCGSTAYNMNAGGAIVDPAVKCMQIVMIAPTTLGARPLILGQNTNLHIKLLKNFKVYSDGILYIEDNENTKQELTISLKKEESNILVPNDFNFYNMLSKKLHWNNGKDV